MTISGTILSASSSVTGLGAWISRIVNDKDAENIEKLVGRKVEKIEFKNADYAKEEREEIFIDKEKVCEEKERKLWKILIPYTDPFYKG